MLQVYPVLSLLQHYRQWDGDAGQPADPGIELGPVEATNRAASLIVESRQFRSTNSAEIWLSKDVPFGLAKWKVTVLREEKDRVEPRSAFQPVSELIEEMEAHETGKDAQPFPEFRAN
ncbi:MAG: hypothetical protein IIA64_04640 [Planctomycetes bacterium]|nr:hypothetical protein [Planctomycetota bacterium]